MTSPQASLPPQHWNFKDTPLWPPLHINVGIVYWTQALMPLRQALSVVPHPLLCMIIIDDGIMPLSILEVSSIALRWIQVTPKFQELSIAQTTTLVFLWDMSNQKSLHLVLLAAYILFWPSQFVLSMPATLQSASASCPSLWCLLLGSHLTFSSCFWSFVSGQ